MTGRGCRRRTGFSLLEILVAASMLAIAVTALSQLASLGSKHLTAATEQAIATRLAANQMARLTAGIDPLTPQEAQPLAEDPTWECQIEALPVALQNSVALPNVAEVRVHVRPAAGAGQALVGEEKRWYTLARWITLRGNASWSGRSAGISPGTSTGTTARFRGRRLDLPAASAGSQPEVKF